MKLRIPVGALANVESMPTRVKNPRSQAGDKEHAVANTRNHRK